MRYKNTIQRMKESFHQNFRYATVNFIFIIIFVNVFQKIFGGGNSIIGVIFAIMMSASMARDLTSTPVRHFFWQAFVLVGMAVAACFVNMLPPFSAFLVNLVVLFAILYTFTYEYSSHLYFPYILSYLFLIFISPVELEGLPLRLLAMVTGALCIILYQLVNGRKRVAETVYDGLITILDEADQYVDRLLTGEEVSDNVELVRKNLCKLSRIVYERRRKKLCIATASFAVLDSGRGLEHLILMLNGLTEPEKHENLLRQVKEQLASFRSFIRKETKTPVLISQEDFVTQEEDELSEEFYRVLSYIQNHLLRMTDPEKRTHYHPTALSFAYRLTAALDISRVRVVYALRVSLLLAAGVLVVRLLGLPHGKWLLFTMASISLPYADDVKQKAGKRLTATLIGGAAGALYYALLPSASARTFLMMLSGYLSFYFSDYTGTFACSTIGALGGAVFMSAFGWGPVGRLLLIRIAYVCLGILIAMAANLIIYPFRRKTATVELLKKYELTTDLLTKLCDQDEVDTQFYYNLVIQAHLMEEKLCQNTPDTDLETMQERLNQCRQAVQNAHRRRHQQTQALTAASA